MICEEITPFDGVPLATGIPIPIPLVPNPTAHTIYNIILPRKTTVDDFGSKSCIDYGAYHFQIPPALGFPIYYSVIPSKCASSVSDLMNLMSHEMVEAATDPLPFFHWIDESTRTPVIGFFSSIPGLLKARRGGRSLLECESGDEAARSGTSRSLVAVVVLDEDAEHSRELLSVADEEPIQTFGASGADEAFGDGVRLG
jgi:hypothetical protein